MNARKPTLVLLALLNVLTLAGGATAAVVTPARALDRPHLVEREPLGAPPVLASSAPAGTAAPSERVPRSRSAVGAVREAMRAPALGPSVSAKVVDPGSGRTLLARRAGVPAAPASTAKLFTAVAALSALGPSARLTTEVVSGGSGDIVLVGGGDPTLASPGARHTYPKPAQLRELARETARVLRRNGTTSVRLSYDTSVFTGPALAPAWKPSYDDQGYVAPLTGLSVDEGRVRPGASERTPDPAQAASETFATLLRQAGITVRGKPHEKTVPESTRRIAAVRSPPLSALVERMLTTSDNMLAEALCRHAARARGKPASFAGATAAIENVVGALGVPTRGLELDDCSGLSHGDRVTARALTGVLTLAVSPKHPELRSVVTGLPVAGFSGTLRTRYEDGRATRAAGFVRAKTGTLTGVSTLAGVAYRPDGGVLIFTFLADRVPAGRLLGARAALDRMVAVLTTR